MELAAAPLNLEELGAPAQPLGLREALVPCGQSYFLATVTVSRLRPLRRRRDSVS
jgi:hypothetical protein